MVENNQIQVVSFYKFVALSTAQISTFQDWINPLFSSLNLRGLFIMSNEGVNSTFSISAERAEDFKKELVRFFAVDSLPFKDSFTDKHPFHDLNVKTRSEIVTLSRPDLVPNGSHHHLSPEEWQKTMKEDDVVVIDARNSYEYEIGHFREALNPETREFNEFPEWFQKSEIPKEKKILIYCTGGIRCEKAILAIEEQGYKNVFQLDGGILNYLAQYPKSEFEGECFVFDYRVAVNQELEPTTKYRLCPHCGQPAKEKITCVQCAVDDVVCAPCLEKGAEFKTCSKNCAHHFRMGHQTKKIHHDGIRARQTPQT